MPPPDDPARPSVSRPLPQYLWVKNDRQIYERFTRHDGGNLYESDDRKRSFIHDHDDPDHVVYSDNPSYDPNSDHHLPNPSARYFPGADIPPQQESLLEKIGK